jgi:hypothetical protein
MPLHDGRFAESFLISLKHYDWPNTVECTVWCPRVYKCYRIVMRTVLEFHYIRTGTGALIPEGAPIPLSNLYITRGDDYTFWSQRVSQFSKSGLDDGTAPICIEFDSHLFLNRHRKLEERVKNTGLLIVCRVLDVKEEDEYSGPRPMAHRIPSSE